MKLNHIAYYQTPYVKPEDIPCGGSAEAEFCVSKGYFKVNGVVASNLYMLLNKGDVIQYKDKVIATIGVKVKKRGVKNDAIDEFPLLFF